MMRMPFQAARDGDLVRIERWAQQQRDGLNSKFDFDDWRPLQLACAEGDGVAVKTLLDAGADVNAKDESFFKACQTALMVAARYGHASICSDLIDSGANTDSSDKFGFTALHYASANGHLRTTQTLLEKGAKDTSTRSSALDLAKAKGHHRVAHLLSGTRGKEDDDKLLKWLRSIGCEAYFSKITDAGYDFDLIQDQGFSPEDIAAIGIPKDKKGHEKKLLTRHKFPTSSNDNTEETHSSSSESAEEGEEEESGSSSSSSEEDDDYEESD